MTVTLLCFLYIEQIRGKSLCDVGPLRNKMYCYASDNQCSPFAVSRLILKYCKGLSAGDERTMT